MTLKVCAHDDKNILNVFIRFAVETKLLEFNSVMGGGGKQSTVKKYNKVASEYCSNRSSVSTIETCLL